MHTPDDTYTSVILNVCTEKILHVSVCWFSSVIGIYRKLENQEFLQIKNKHF